MSNTFVDNMNSNSGPQMLKAGRPRASTPGLEANKYSSYNSTNSAAIQRSMLMTDTSATDLVTVSNDSELRAIKRQNVRKKRAKIRAAQGRGQKLQNEDQNPLS